MSPHPRGIDPKLQNGWIYSIQREDKLRLRWFRKHEERLNEIANKSCSRIVPEEDKEKFAQEMIESLRNTQRFPRKKIDELEPREPSALHDYMKPVDPDLKKVLYGKDKDSREQYLRERAHIIPEKRYYLPECSSWIYGWNMWDTVKTMTKYPYAREEVIKNSFYRRRGVERDPDWYREPAMYSPTICMEN
ncbi:protein SPMIP1-like [Diabrotica undecimpunctata]|uniref:protein SPMIP1-like n=1 Tax=Diabrotica undecimpunctata TaxID=50387 RepID=UPI003B63CE28